MPSKTSIEWCDYSSNALRARNPATGASGHYCEKISSGCANCYSSTLQKRFKMPAFGSKKSDLATLPLLTDSDAVPVIGGLEVYLNEKEQQHRLTFRPKGPFVAGERHKVFVEDMSDLFGSWVPEEWIEQCLWTFACRSDVDWLVLTKRPERMAEVIPRVYARWNQGELHSEDHAAWYGYHRTSTLPELPLKNVWLGTSCENQEQADKRIPWLLKCPAAVRFVSAEPLLGAIKLTTQCDIPPDEEGPWRIGYMVGPDDGQSGLSVSPGDALRKALDWLIVGGESGHNARDCPVEAILSLVDQCKEAEVPVFVKQVGARATQRVGNGITYLPLVDPKGGNPDEWDPRLRVREFPGPVSNKE